MTPDGRQDEVRALRDDFDHLPGVIEAQRRLVTHSHRVFPAFDSLDIFDHRAAQEYLQRPLGALRVPEDQRGRMIGVVLAFAMTCVEADRRSRKEDSLE